MKDGADFGQSAKEISKRWAAMDADARQQYTEKAEEVKKGLLYL